MLYDWMSLTLILRKSINNYLNLLKFAEIESFINLTQ